MAAFKYVTNDILARCARSLGFEPLQSVTGRATVADLVPDRQRTGVYLLGFRASEAYVGLSKNIAFRFVQHCRTAFWSVTAFPGRGDLLRVNAHWQEVFAASTRHKRTRFYARDRGALERTLALRPVRRAIREFNLRLIQKGPRSPSKAGYRAGERAFDGLAPVDEAPVGNQFIHAVEQVRVHGDGNFRLGRSVLGSMVRQCTG